MQLTSAQIHLARRAARMLLRYQICVLRDGTRPGKVLLEYDEAQCLLAAAAAHCPELGLAESDLDLGPFHAAGVSPPGEPPLEPAHYHPS